MMTTLPTWKFAALALALFVAADDAPKRTVEAGKVSFEVLEDWKSTEPSSRMRLAQLSVAAKEGDKDPAELVLFGFPNGAGTVKANIDRWQKQFEDKDGNPPKITTDSRKGKDVDVTFAETSGRYVANVTPGSPEKFDKSDWRLLGAIVVTDDASYFFKMVGPDKTMKAAKPAFEAMIKTISVGKK